MNKARRAVLNKIINALSDLKDELETVKDEEEEAMDRLFYGTTDKKRSKGTQEKT